MNETKEVYENFLESEDWKTKKSQIIKERGLVCEKCGREMTRWESQLHHKDYDNELGEELNESLMLVCLDCHNELHQDLEFF